jgi:FkbM family methyltransferase
MIGALLERLCSFRQHVDVVQIGSFVGNDGNDHLFEALKRLCKDDSDGSVRAVLVEPVQAYFKKLILNYADCTRYINFENVAIATEFGLQRFFILREGAPQAAQEIPEWTWQLGSLLENRTTELWDQFERDPRIKQFLLENKEEIRVVGITFDQLLLKNKLSKVDFLQIDAEGFDYEIIKSIDLIRQRPTIINYERVLLGDQQAECVALLRRHGYVVADHSIDTLAVVESFAGQIRDIVVCE